MDSLKCSECGELTVDRCPECTTKALCPKCRKEWETCDECGGEDDDDDDMEDFYDDLDEQE